MRDWSCLMWTLWRWRSVLVYEAALLPPSVLVVYLGILCGTRLARTACPVLSAPSVTLIFKKNLPWLFENLQDEYFGNMLTATLLFLLNFWLSDMFVIIVLQAYDKIHLDLSDRAFNFDDMAENCRWLRRQPGVCCGMGLFRYIWHIIKTVVKQLFDYSEDEEEQLMMMPDDDDKDEDMEMVTLGEQARRDKEQAFFMKIREQMKHAQHIRGNLGQLSFRLQALIADKEKTKSLAANVETMLHMQGQLDKVLLMHCTAVLGSLAQLEGPEQCQDLDHGEEETADITMSSWAPSIRARNQAKLKKKKKKKNAEFDVDVLRL